MYISKGGSEVGSGKFKKAEPEKKCKPPCGAPVVFFQVGAGCCYHLPPSSKSAVSQCRPPLPPPVLLLLLLSARAPFQAPCG